MFDRSSLTRWRQRMGEEKLVALLQERLAVTRRVEAPEQCVVLGASNQPEPKAVSEEVKFNVRIRAFALPIVAINDLFSSDASPGGTLPGALEALP